MRISDGVEWAVHVCGVLAAVPEGRGLPGAKLAEFHELPPAYLAKHLQALSRAGIVTGGRGAKGGYRLARAPSAISLLDIVIAIEGPQPAFRCTEIRQRGPCPAPPSACRAACPISRAFHAAEALWREALAGVTIAEMNAAAADESFDAKRRSQFRAWLVTALG
ncbi:transcriptional regulator [Sphingomonas sp. IBVSS2]|uniref:RrF2 family transcriptional regulator n=1 Tax=Sphingomonas sp. IBVSS2 TaxID=1985172 RepID=UPI000A2E3197|nr:Rrf2 family transcriptional regulator [Sphingomonas sp. IBVSS2]OSZ66285.1 transcriptional regulator [Sphingomonas sp. IBVSS2]